jgi:hypothetical protein
VWVDLDRFNAVDVAAARPIVFSWRLLAHDDIEKLCSTTGQ